MFSIFWTVNSFDVKCGVKRILTPHHIYTSSRQGCFTNPRTKAFLTSFPYCCLPPSPAPWLKNAPCCMLRSYKNFPDFPGSRLNRDRQQLSNSKQTHVYQTFFNLDSDSSVQAATKYGVWSRDYTGSFSKLCPVACPRSSLHVSPSLFWLLHINTGGSSRSARGSVKINKSKLVWMECVK